MTPITKSQRAALLVAFVGAPSAFALACNVFASVDGCDADGDCPSGRRCDRAANVCVSANDGETGAPDTGADAFDGGADGDAPDTEAPHCRATDPFTSFAQVKGLETVPIISARLVADKTVIFSALNGCTDQSCYDLFSASRKTIDDPFGAPIAFPNINCSTAEEYWPTLTSDSLLVFFESSRKNGPSATCGSDRARIWSSYRSNQAEQAWSDPRLDARFNLGIDVVDSAPYLHPDPKNRSLYFVSLGRDVERDAGGGQDIFVSTTDPQGFLDGLRALDEINTAGEENFPVIALDDKTLLFARSETDGGVGHDVWTARRDDPAKPFGSPTLVGGLDGPDDDIPAWLSDDACRLYFTSNRPHPSADDGGPLTSFRLWVATRQKR